MNNYYKILEVKNFASPEEIKIAHRKLVKKLHPDVNGGDKLLEEKFKVVQRAYEILSDPNQKARYDEVLKRMLQKAYLISKIQVNASSIQRMKRPSSYVFDRGRYVKRKRF